MAALKPSEELVAASFAVATVVAVYGSYTANVNDLQAAQPSHQNTNDATRAALLATAIVSGVSLLARSPTVFVAGGVVIIAEYWMRAHANYTMPKQQQ
jgi:hypothetical protein